MITKKIIVVSLLMYSGFTFAVESKSVWNATSLTPEVIKKIQLSQINYKKCVIKEMKKPGYQKIDSRQATGRIIKQCEPILGKMRTVYREVKVPGIIADRHLKKMRIQTTRKLLQELIFREASKKAGK